MAPPARYPDFSDPAPVARRLPDAPAPVLIEPTHVVILRDDKTNVRFMSETTLGQTFGAVVRDLVDGQIPQGCSLDSIRFDDGERVVTDVTAKALVAVLTLCVELGSHVSLPLVSAFGRYGIDLPAPFESEGSVQSDTLTPGRRAA